MGIHEKVTEHTQYKECGFYFLPLCSMQAIIDYPDKALSSALEVLEVHSGFFDVLWIWTIIWMYCHIS